MLILNTILVLLLCSLSILVAIWFTRKPDWMGLSGKTLWDWIGILTVPIFIGFSALYFNLSQRDLERVHQEELSVQTYIEQMSDLVLETERTASHLSLAQARTSAVLHLASQDRATRALRFLDDFDLLKTLEISLEELDLSRAEMKGLRLESVDFEGSNLDRVDMEGGYFSKSDFENANLNKSDLKGADFRFATFEGANLRGAQMDYADFRGADLSLAMGLNEKQVLRACLDETTKLPAGFSLVSAETDICSQQYID